LTEALRVVSALTEELDTATRAAIVEVCVAAHQEEDFHNLFNYVQSGGWHVIAYWDGQLASHAMASTRWLQPAGHPVLKAAYVDAVATLPAHQGRECGSTVMRQLASDVAQTHVLACLETEQTGFFQRLGWRLWRGPLAGRSEHGLVPTPDQTGIMILQLHETPVLDLDSLLTIECQPGRIW
jgi:GNAT superfamily N-acetyltransferase